MLWQADWQSTAGCLLGVELFGGWGQGSSRLKTHRRIPGVQLHLRGELVLDTRLQGPPVDEIYFHATHRSRLEAASLENFIGMWRLCPLLSYHIELLKKETTLIFF